MSDIEKLGSDELISETFGKINTNFENLKNDIANKQDAGNYVTYTANSNITAGKKTGTTYTFGQSPMVVKNGIVIGGTAQNAGLVTRGICGVTVPTDTGSCELENLYINYDGDNNYKRQVILGASDWGSAITTSTGASTVPTYQCGTTQSAVRGDQMVNYVTAKLANYKVSIDSTLSTTSTNPVQNKVITNALAGKADASALATVATSGSYNDLTNKPTIPSAYTLPTATASTLGGVKVGSNITVSSGTISLTKANVTSALGYTPPTTNTTYSVATTSSNGLMSSTDKSKLDNLATVATSGYYNDLYGTPTLATVATSGSYNDLSDTPTIPSITSSTTDLTAGTSTLATGAIYLVYE